MKDASNRGRQAFRLKGTMPLLTTLCLLTEDIEAIDRQLGQRLSQMPQFFLHSPIVVDLDGLGDARIDLARLADLLRRHQLVPVAVRNPSDVQRERAVAAGWGILQNGADAGPRVSSSAETSDVDVVVPRGSGDAPAMRPARSGRERASEGTAPSAELAERVVPSLTVRTPVRSGQVVYARGADLVVLAQVSSGAELIADGNIHVYAPLRGRALAGAYDNAEASIFCMNLEAELLSVAGRHLLADEIPEEHRGKAVRAHIKDDRLVITRI
jgi:septum site-determining protein MinC